MKTRTYAIPLKVRAAGGQPQLVSVDLDLADSVRKSGLGGVPDPFSLRVRSQAEPHRCQSVQWRPHFIERLPLDAPGSPTWICRYSADPGAPADPRVRMPGTASFAWPPGSGDDWSLECDVYEASWAVQVPYPPNHFQIVLSDDRVPPRHAPFPAARVTPNLEGQLEITVGDRPFTTYVYASQVRKPYFYPVLGPSLHPLTRLGHPHDPTGSHRHHRSLWIAHGNINGVDFWHDWRPGTGEIRHVSIAEHQQGPHYAGIDQELEWRAGDEVHLREHRRLKAYELGGTRFLDVESRFRAERAVTIGESPFGFLAFRSAENMTPYDGAGVIRNASGQYNDSVCRVPARWADYSGPTGPERWGGIAIMDHPGNPNHPTPYYCRNDGWLGACATVLEPIVLAAGEARTFRWRLVVREQNGVPDEGWYGALDELAGAFARPVEVELAGPAHDIAPTRG